MIAARFYHEITIEECDSSNDVIIYKSLEVGLKYRVSMIGEVTEVAKVTE